MRKFLKIFGIAIFILLLILLVYMGVIHFDGFLNKDNVMTREEVVALLEKGKEYPNYYYSSQDKWIFGEIDQNRTEYYIKDGIVKCVNNGSTTSWANYNTDAIITIMGEHEGKKYAAISSLTKYYGDDTSKENQNGFDYSLISNEEVFNTEFEYLGEKQYDNRTTIIIKVWNRDGLEIDSTKFYIDKETGLIMRRVDYSCLGLIKIDCNRNVKLDAVTDEDVESPDLTGYELLK